MMKSKMSPASQVSPQHIHPSMRHKYHWTRGHNGCFCQHCLVIDNKLKNALGELVPWLTWEVTLVISMWKENLIVWQHVARKETVVETIMSLWASETWEAFSSKSSLRAPEIQTKRCTRRSGQNVEVMCTHPEVRLLLPVCVLTHGLAKRRKQTHLLLVFFCVSDRTAARGVLLSPVVKINCADPRKFAFL